MTNGWNRIWKSSGKCPATIPHMTNFQARGVKQGAAFEEQCRSYLAAIGYKLLGPHTTDVGCRVDEAAEAPSGQLVYFEYKGSFTGKRPGMRRTDTAKKAYLTGYMLRDTEYRTVPYVIIASHPPNTLSGRIMLAQATGNRRWGKGRLVPHLDGPAVDAVLTLNDPAATEYLEGL